MRLPAKVAPSRHMVEPQSPLYMVSKNFKIAAGFIPEVGNDLIATVSLLLMLLWGALGDLEPILGVDGVARVSAAANLTAVGAVAEDLKTRQRTTLLEDALPTLASLSPCTS